jgi:hypothetical protein
MRSVSASQGEAGIEDSEEEALVAGAPLRSRHPASATSTIANTRAVWKLVARLRLPLDD